MKVVGKPCEGEPHARFDVAGIGNGFAERRIPRLSSTLPNLPGPMLTRTPLTRLPPSKGTRPASCRGARVPAASPPPHLSPPGKPFGLPQVAAMPICPGRASTVCHLLSSFHLFCAARLRVAASSGHCGRVPNGLNQLAGNQQQAQSLPPAPRGLQFIKESCQRQKVSSNFL